MNEHGIRQGDALPEVSEDTLARIESRVFDEIGRDRRAGRPAARRRRRVWQAVGAAAAIVTVAAVISPAVLQSVGRSTSGGDAAVFSTKESGPAPDMGVSAPEVATEDGVDASGGRAAPGQDGEIAREVIRTGSATVVVDDVAEAADEVAALASEYDGWVESLSIGEDARVMTDQGVVTDYIPVPENGGWVSIRIPAERLETVMEELADIGEVTATRIGTEDVTTVTRDLRARIDAVRGSVERLTTLLGQAATVTELVEVETQLSARQAELESLESQLEYYDSQLAMSSLSVTLTEDAPAVKPDPTGFGDGLEAGWNGLLATVNGIVIAIGFLLPWLAVIGLAWLIVWAAVRLVRRRRRARAEEPAAE